MALKKIYLEEGCQKQQKESVSLLLSAHSYCLTEEKKEADLCIFCEGLDHKSLRVEKKGRNCRICYGESVFLFRGLSLLLQNAEKETWEIQEISRFDSNGLMLDCSRNGVPTVETIKKYIMRQAEFGMNRLYLYMEDTFEVEGYPYWGYLRGRYTKKELKECDAFASEFGITLIPCIQTLAHLRSVLKQPMMEQYKDIDDILLLETPETETLLRKILKTMKECFSGGMIHLGMDEAAHLGRGKYLERKGFQDPASIMKRHLEWLMKECRELNLKPMIWSDMYLRLNFGVEDYYSLGEDAMPRSHENLSSEIPLCYWDYYNEGSPFYEKYIHLHRKLGNPVIFAGGAWTWNGIAPGVSKAFRTTQDALEACQREGIKDVFCTVWMDNGAETPLDAVLPLLALYGEYGFSSRPDPEKVKERFAFCFKKNWEDYCLLDAFDNPSYKKEEIEKIYDLSSHNSRCKNPSKTILYEDNFMGKMTDLYDEQKMKLQYEDLEKKLKRLLQKEEMEEDQNLFQFYEVLAGLLVVKSGLNEKIRKAYENGEKQLLLGIAEKELGKIEELAEKLRCLRQKIWMKEYKPFGYEILDIRFAGVGIRARSERERLKNYVLGNLELLEELEEELLPYKTKERLSQEALHRCSLWEEIVSAGNMEGV